MKSAAWKGSIISYGHLYAASSTNLFQDYITARQLAIEHCPHYRPPIARSSLLDPTGIRTMQVRMQVQVQVQVRRIGQSCVLHCRTQGGSSSSAATVTWIAGEKKKKPKWQLVIFSLWAVLPDLFIFAVYLFLSFFSDRWLCSMAGNHQLERGSMTSSSGELCPVTTAVFRKSTHVHWSA